MMMGAPLRVFQAARARRELPARRRRARAATFGSRRRRGSGKGDERASQPARSRRGDRDLAAGWQASSALARQNDSSNKRHYKRMSLAKQYNVYFVLPGTIGAKQWARLKACSVVEAAGCGWAQQQLSSDLLLQVATLVLSRRSINSHSFSTRRAVSDDDDGTSSRESAANRRPPADPMICWPIDTQNKSPMLPLRWRPNWITSYKSSSSSSNDDASRASSSGSIRPLDVDGFPRRNQTRRAPPLRCTRIV